MSRMLYSPILKNEAEREAVRTSVERERRELARECRIRKQTLLRRFLGDGEGGQRHFKYKYGDK